MSDFEGALVTRGAPDLLVVLEVRGLDTSGWMLLAQECAARSSAERPTVLVPVSSSARDDIAKSLYSRTPGGTKVELPCDASILRVELDGEGRDADVLLKPEAPMFESAKGRSAIHSVAGFLSFVGLMCTVEEPDDSILYADVHYRTGETGREQVLGWDDVYGEDYACALKRIEIRLLIQERVLSEYSKRRALSRVLMAARPTRYEAMWMDEGEACIMEGDCGHARQQEALEELRALVKDEFEALREEVSDMASKFKVNESGRCTVSTEEYDRYRDLIARAKRHKEILAGGS